MDPCSGTQAGSFAWLPRASGDGPADRRRPIPDPLAAPRERGWTPRPRGIASRPAGCPARAGMDLCGSTDPTAGLRLPRASGDGPEWGAGMMSSDVAAPRERGWTPRPIRTMPASSGCPARAGMDPCGGVRHRPPCRLPRASGDGPIGAVFAHSMKSAAPRERGWTLWRLGAHVRLVGCPARAGMDPWPGFHRVLMPGLPRASGDGPPLHRASASGE